jgi:hypothetical protein
MSAKNMKQGRIMSQQNMRSKFEIEKNGDEVRVSRAGVNIYFNRKEAGEAVQALAGFVMYGNPGPPLTQSCEVPWGPDDKMSGRHAM